jgi:hypothetical protein
LVDGSWRLAGKLWGLPAVWAQPASVEDIINGRGFGPGVFPDLHCTTALNGRSCWRGLLGLRAQTPERGRNGKLGVIGLLAALVPWQ